MESTGEAVERAIKDEPGLTKKKLCDDLDIGTTTLWRACTGRSIEAKAALALCERFPQLDFESLIYGDKGKPGSAAAAEEHSADSADDSSESGERGAVDPEKRDASGAA